MDTRQLRYFVAVAEERHFGRAAERLRMAQPPLSQQIRQLEQALGTALLVRTTRRVDLTPAGALLLERGRRVLQELDAIAGDVQQVGAGALGVLRVGFTGSATYDLMPKAVREAERRLPGLSLNIRGEMLTPQLVAELLEHRLDVAILRPPVHSAEIAFEVISREPLVAVLPADSPLGNHEVLTLSQLAEAPFVGYPGDSSVAGAIMNACQAAGFRPHILQEAKETSTLLSLVAAGTGVALVPAAARAVVINGTIFREVADPPTVDLAIAWRADESSPLVANFIAMLRELGENKTVELTPLQGTHR
ncbi:MAG: LysR substrate-binding domain-containing protein [Microbacteriaceae bacterium]